MKKLALLFVVLLFGAAAFAEDSMKVEIEKFKIKVPVMWMVQYTKSTTLFLVYAPATENDTFQENASLVVEQLPAKMSVSDYMKAALKQIEPYYEEFELVETKGNYMVFKGVLNGVSVKQVQFYYINNKEAYILTFSSTPEDFDDYAADFNNIAESFSYK